MFARKIKDEDKGCCQPINPLEGRNLFNRIKNFSQQTLSLQRHLKYNNYEYK